MTIDDSVEKRRENQRTFRRKTQKIVNMRSSIPVEVFWIFLINFLAVCRKSLHGNDLYLLEMVEVHHGKFGEVEFILLKTLQKLLTYST